MKSIVNSFKTILCLAFVAVVLNSANAAVITTTDSTPWVQLNDSSGFLTVNQFNPLAGTLTDVEFVFNTQLRGTANFVSFWSTTSSFNVNSYTVQSSVNAYLNSPFATYLTSSPFFQLAPPVFTVGPNSSTLIPFSAVDTDTFLFSVTPSNFADFSSFVGTGSTNISLSALLNASSSTSGQGGIDLFADYKSTLTVNYFYDRQTPPDDSSSVPETSTAISASVFALIGSVIVFRHRKGQTSVSK